MAWIITLLISRFSRKLKVIKQRMKRKINIKIYMYVMLKARKLDWRESLIVECKTTKSFKNT